MPRLRAALASVSAIPADGDRLVWEWTRRHLDGLDVHDSDIRPDGSGER